MHGRHWLLLLATGSMSTGYRIYCVIGGVLAIGAGIDAMGNGIWHSLAGLQGTSARISGWFCLLAGLVLIVVGTFSKAARSDRE